jgi:hypothetical protein
MVQLKIKIMFKLRVEFSCHTWKALDGLPDCAMLKCMAVIDRNSNIIINFKAFMAYLLLLNNLRIV